MPKIKNNEGIVEATLFIAGRYLTKDDLVMFTGINPISLDETLKKLEDKYSKNEGALTLSVKNNLYKMDIKQDYAWLTNKLASGSAEFTKAEQETLAIIAYKQPITQSVVVKIRGNKAYEHVKKLVDIGLIKGKRVGHTLELRLDDTFYNYFGLKNKERLEDEGKKAEESAKAEDEKAGEGTVEEVAKSIGEGETSKEELTSENEVEEEKEEFVRTNEVSEPNQSSEDGQEAGDTVMEGPEENVI